MRYRILALTLLTSAGSSSAPAGWRDELVDATRHFSRSSIAISSLGDEGIAYGDDGLHYATWNGLEWNIVTVDAAACTGWPSLVFTDQGDPVIAYYDREHLDLRLASRRDGRWYLEVVDSTGDVGAYAALALHPATGYPGIAYVDRTRIDIKLAEWTGSAWAIEVPEAAGGLWSSFAYDRRGEPAISYVTGNRMEARVARRDGATWTRTTVGTVIDPLQDRINFTSLAIDPDGEPAVAWDRLDGARDAHIRVARWNGGDWVNELAAISKEWSYPALAFNLAGEPAVAYIRQNDDTVHLARRAGPWSSTPIGGPASAPDLTFAADGRARVSWFDASTARLEVARGPSPGWQIGTVDSYQLDAQPRPSLALDHRARPAVSYVLGDARVTFAARVSSTWTVYDVDRAPGVERTSLAIDSDGAPGIAYGGPGLGALRFASWDGLGFELEDVTVDADEHLSLAFGPDDLPAIAFRDAQGFGLVLARADLGLWSFEVVDPLPFAGADPTLRFDAKGLPSIAYTDDSDANLRFASWDDDARRWVIEVVDELGDVGLGPCLAFDGLNQPAIAYYHDGDRELRYAVRDAGSWRVERVAAVSFDVAPACSLAFDSALRPTIAYAADRVSVRLALRVDRGWVTEPVSTDGDGPSFAVDATGIGHLAYRSVCPGDIRYARTAGAGVLIRAAVTRLDAGWRAVTLPLTLAGDDETAPFPIETLIPGSSEDSAPPPGDLTLYRVLWDDGTPTRNTLRVGRAGGGIQARY